MGKFLILPVADHEEHILNKIMEALADEPELDHIALPLSDDTCLLYTSGIRCLSCRMGQIPLKRQVAIPHISEWDFTAAEFYVKNMVDD